MSSEYLEEALLQANELAVDVSASEARMQAILASVADGVITIEGNGRVESANLAAERLFGTPTQQLVGRPIAEIIPDLQNASGASLGNREVQARRLDGTTLSVELSLSSIELSEGVLLLVVARDISERKATIAELERMAGTDGMTGLANRHRGAREIEQLLLLAARHHRPVTVSVLDMDHFKQLNDTYGHPTGDEVLRRLAIVLPDIFRKTDIVARWGGEEFLIGLYDGQKLDAVRRLELAQHVFADQAVTAHGGGPVHATFSAGVAEYPADGRNLEELYRAADAALYLAKAAGRACVLPTP